MQASPANQRTSHRNLRQQPAISAVARRPVEDLVEVTRSYIRANPEAAALWCFGIGFVLGWKLKLW